MDLGVFTLPAGLHAYEPCAQIRKFKKILAAGLAAEPSLGVHNIECALRENATSITSIVYITGGSETKVFESLLSSVLDTIVNLMMTKCGKTCTLRNLKTTKPSVIVKSSNPEPGIVCEFPSISHTITLVGSEAKGAESGYLAAIFQAFQVCADIALEQLGLGIALDAVFVPGVLCYSGTFQFIAVYLAPPSFPCLSLLSRPLNLCYHSDRSEMAVFLSCLAEFLSDSVVANLRSILLESKDPSTQQMMTPVLASLAGSEQHFFKPVRGRCAVENGFISTSLCNLDSILTAYHALSVIPSSEECILFPVGIVTFSNPSARTSSAIVDMIKECLLSDFPGTDFPIGSPLLIFNRLDNSWTNTKPPKSLHELYRNALRSAIEVFVEAKVAHLDLRPSNIMWREVDGAVKLRIIDLELCIFFGETISPSLVEKNAGDERYPFINEDLELYDNFHITANIYEWWCESIRLWLQSTTEIHEDFMVMYTRKAVISKVRNEELIDYYIRFAFLL